MANRIKPAILKGTRDYLPGDAVKREYIIEKLKTIFRKYGFDPLETPSIELWDTLGGKYGEDAEMLIYRFKDHGGRDVGLRYDLTVPLSRVIAMHQEIPKPFKRYQIAPVWRADSPQKGRYREFYQCDFDIVGSSSLMADAEIIAIVFESLVSLGFKDFVIRINSRKVIRGLVEVAGIPVEREQETARTIDKLDKIGVPGVLKELERSGFERGSIEKIEKIITVDFNSNIEALEFADEFFKDSESGLKGIYELRELLEFIQILGVPEKNISIDLSLARGLDYYTGPIYEAVLRGVTLPSVSGGGRYDGLIKIFSGRDFPATGGSLGLERIYQGLVDLDLLPDSLKTHTHVLVTVFNKKFVKESASLAKKLREHGLNVDLYLGKKNLRAQLGYANDRGIRFAIFYGPDEMEGGVVTLKDLKLETQKRVRVEEVVEIIKEAFYGG